MKDGFAFVPEVRFHQKWYSICGHHFWNNNNGANTFCKALGFSRGWVGRGQPYNSDSVEVGSCNAGQSLDACTGGGNKWGSPDAGSWCRKGQNVGITVTCLAAVAALKKEGLS